MSSHDDALTRAKILSFLLRAYASANRPQAVQLSLRTLGRPTETVADINTSEVSDTELGALADELAGVIKEKVQKAKKSQRYELAAEGHPPLIFVETYTNPSTMTVRQVPRREDGSIRGRGSEELMDFELNPDAALEGEFEPEGFETSAYGIGAPLRHQAAAFSLLALDGYRDMFKMSMSSFRAQRISDAREIERLRTRIHHYEQTHDDLVAARENALSQQAERDRLKAAGEREDSYRSTALVSILAAAPELIEKVIEKPLSEQQRALFAGLAQAHLTGDPKAVAAAAGNATKGLLSPAVAHVAASETGSTQEGVVLRAGQAAILLSAIDQWLSSLSAKQLGALAMTKEQTEAHAQLITIFERERGIFKSLAEAERAGKVESKLTSQTEEEPKPTSEVDEKEAERSRIRDAWFSSIAPDQMKKLKAGLSAGQFTLLERLVEVEAVPSEDKVKVQVNGKVVAP